MSSTWLSAGNRAALRTVSSMWRCCALLAAVQTCAVAPDPAPRELAGVTKGWVANTWDGSPGGVTNTSQWVPIAMDGFFVKENDGSLYGATMWDESGHESSTWSADGDMLGALVDTHGWARGGGQDIAADDSFVYSSQRQAPCGDGVSKSLENAATPSCTWPGGPTRYPINETWYTIRRYKNQPGYPADNVSESGGVGMGYDWSMTVIATTPWSTVHKASDTSVLTGVAVGGGIVAVSDNSTSPGMLHILDAKTMASKAKHPMTNPSRLAYDTKRGQLWCTHRSSWQAAGNSDTAHDTITLIDPHTGTSTGCTVTSIVRVMSLSYHTASDSLVVSDGGPRQQVLIINAATCAIRETVGEEGGVFCGKTPGRMGPLRFYGPTGAGMDANGSLYVVSGGGRAERGGYVRGGGTNMVKLSRTSDGAPWELRWQRLGLTFTDMAGLDPADPTHMYSRNYKFRTNFSAPLGQGSFFTVQAYTLDPFRYPDDPRLHLDPTEMTVRNIPSSTSTAKPHKLMFGWDMYASYLAGWRFIDDSDIAVPSVLFGRAVASQHPDPPPWPSVDMGALNYSDWIWADANEDGAMQREEFSAVEHSLNGWAWAVDSSGAVWNAFNFETYMPGNGRGWGGVDFGGNDTMKNHTAERYRVLSVTAGGVPLYDTKDSAGLTTTVPKFSECFGPCNNGRIDYDVASDRMILAGFTAANPDVGKQWGQVGTEACVYLNWSQQVLSRTFREEFCLQLPYSSGGPTVGSGKQVKAIKVVGQHVFAVEGTSAGVHVYDLSTRAEIGVMTPHARSGWVDTPYGIDAIKLPDGRYVVAVEEDSKAKTNVYVWEPISRIPAPVLA